MSAALEACTRVLQNSNAFLCKSLSSIKVDSPLVRRRLDKRCHVARERGTVAALAVERHHAAAGSRETLDPRPAHRKTLPPGHRHDGPWDSKRPRSTRGAGGVDVDERRRPAAPCHAPLAGRATSPRTLWSTWSCAGAWGVLSMLSTEGQIHVIKVSFRLGRGSLPRDDTCCAQRGPSQLFIFLQRHAR